MATVHRLGVARAPSEQPRSAGVPDRSPQSAGKEDSWQLARDLSTLFGKRAPVVDRYLEGFSCAPPGHLRLLRRRDARICFAPTIYHALSSAWATRRRGRPLRQRERREIRL